MSTQPRVKDLVAANRRTGHVAEPSDPVKTGPATVQAGMRLLPEEMAQAQALARSDERSVSNFLRRVYLRGIASYLAENGSGDAAQQ